MIPFSLVSQAIGLGGASGTRAGLSLLAVAVAAHTGHVSLPPELAWMAHPGAMGGFLVVLAYEVATHRDEDMRMLLGLVQYGLSAASGAAVVLASLEVPTGDVPPWALGAGGALLAVGSLALRRRLHTALAALESELFHPQKWLNRLEEGGTLGLCVAVFLAAPLALAVVVLAVVAGIAAGVVAHRVEARFRRPCPECRASIREEASRCPRCRAEVPVAKRLDAGLAEVAQATLQGVATSAMATAERLGRAPAR